MDLSLTPDQAAFREECRVWLAAHHPGALTGTPDQRFEQRIAWQRTLNAAGWAAVHWPEVFGGRGATMTEAALFYAESASLEVPLPANEIGLLLAGPTLMAHGSPEQRERFLPPILAADEIWCQGFSEPEAGSDLASVRTTAVRDGGDWVVSGQKTWTSFAQWADWCLLVARVDPDPSLRHRGLGYFLMDMRLEGIDIRPIRQMTGESEFNEMFLDEVRIPDACMVAGPGDGWMVAMTTLMAERSGLGFYFQMSLRKRLDDLLGVAAARGALDDGLAARFGELHVRCEALRHLAWGALTALEQGTGPGRGGSVTKWLWSETEQQLAGLALDVLGAEALAPESPWAFQLLRAPGYSIEGGTTQIQKNIVAQHVLGLPKAA